MMISSIGKRAGVIALTAAVIIAVAALFAEVFSPRAAAETTVPDYSVTDFSSVATGDWTLNPKCDTVNSTAKVNESGELVVSAVNAAEAMYYGALLEINPGKDYTNFTFELVFKVNKALGDQARWLAVMYRTRYATEQRPVTGYIMNYRLNGQNAYSAVNASAPFHDIDVIPPGGTLADGETVAPPIFDGDYHNITITMEGDTAKHYIDGNLIRVASVQDQAEYMGGKHDDGGFALIVNCMELAVKSCTVTADEIKEPQKVVADNVTVTTYQDPNIKIKNAPTVVCDVTDASALEKIFGERRPSNAILRFDKDANVVDANGRILGGFDEIYARLDHKIIPIAHISDAASADALIYYLSQTRRILDIAVMSSDPELVKKVRMARPSVRGIVEYSADDLYTDGKLELFYNVVGKTNAARAMVAVLPQSVANAENVRYIQARFKTVWVRPDNERAFDVRNCVNSGAFGIVDTNFEIVYDVLESYAENSYTRMPYNVAHRGMHNNVPQGPYENSLGAVEAAIEIGATHLELDGHLTKDGEIVIMHDPTLDRTTNSTGNIGDKTAAEIRSIKLNDGQDVPFLQDVLDVLCKAKAKGTDIVFVLELKAGKTIVKKIDSLLGTGDGQYDIRENIVIITFNNSGDDLLTDVMNIMPETPTSYLNGNAGGVPALAANLLSMGRYNCGLDMIYVSATNEYYDKFCLTDRGNTSWYWTFGDVNGVITAAKRGHLGLTNNAPAALAEYVEKIEGAENAPRETLKAGDAVKVAVTRYNGKTEIADGRVDSLRKLADKWEIFASYTSNDMTLYSQAFTVEKKEAPPPVVITKYTVRVYNGTNEIFKVTAESGDSVEFVPPEIDGYTFEGLFTDNTFKTAATMPEKIMSNVTLFAKYVASGTGEPDDPNRPDAPDDPNKPDEPNDPSGEEKPSGGEGDKNGGLSAGAIAGIAVGCAACAALAAGAAVFTIKKKKKDR